MRNYETFVAIQVPVRVQHDDGSFSLAERWKWAGQSKGHTYLVGYCMTASCAGHDSPDDARDHYRLYLVMESSLENEATYAVMACAVCDQETLGYATTPDGYMIPLCDAHRTHGVLASLVDTFDGPGMQPAGVIQITEYLEARKIIQPANTDEDDPGG